MLKNKQIMNTRNELLNSNKTTGRYEHTIIKFTI